ncbi:MAG: hypothetical protein FVQ84_21610 [Planctomycetes bacterium]|nr:hypothetical protein [Planctomycetota bacterium]
MNNLKKEDGYILIVIVGILMVFSLMAITFATLSRVETKAARNYADSVKCEAVARAGLEHAIYELRLDKFGTDTLAYNDNDNNNYGLDENFDASGTSWPGNAIFPGTDYDNDGDSTNDSQWVYIPGTDTATSAIRLPGSLRARYAVLITDDREARVNINVSGNQPGDEGTSTTEIDMSSVIELAPGLIPADGDNIASDIISKRSTMPFGVLTEAEIVGITGTSTAYTSRLEESFAAYIGAYEDRKGTLTAFSADTIVCPSYTLGTSTATTMLNINALIYNEGAYTNTGTYNSNKKVEMIRDVLEAGGITGAVGSAGYKERHQLAVNIKDFIDSDDTVTTYLDVVPDPDVTYYGVEKTPYINEVEAKPGGDEFIELYNPYGTETNIAGWTITGTSMGTITIDAGATMGTDTYYVIADGGAADEIELGMDLVDNGEELTLKTSPASGSKTVQVTNYGPPSGSPSKTVSLDDPRPPWSWASGTSNTIGAENDPSIFNPTFGSDNWTYVTYPSSFVIANRRFSNKGYLCYIHTGNPWTSFAVDTTDVFEYITITDPSMDGIDNDGDDDIDSADTGAQAGDIDGPEYRIHGLINVNTASTKVLQSLPNIDSIIGDAIDTGGKPYTSIGDLVDRVTEITNTGADKWEKEKPLRSISNLITTRSNVFTVYVTAQVTDDAGSSVFAEKRIMAIVDRSVDPIRVRYFRWITE